MDRFNFLFSFTAIDMSVDHKPEDPPELERIVRANGRVTMDGRVNGGLNLSRAIGDHAYKTVIAIYHLSNDIAFNRIFFFLSCR